MIIIRYNHTEKNIPFIQLKPKGFYSGMQNVESRQITEA